jgi:stage II sporulation protein P
MRDFEHKIKNGREFPLLEQEHIKDIYFKVTQNKKKNMGFGRKMACSVVFSLFAIFLIAIGYIWGNDMIDGDNNIIAEKSETENITETFNKGERPVESDAFSNDFSTDESLADDVDIWKQLYSYDKNNIPTGHGAIIPKDLSMYQKGATYINNTTGLIPDIKRLLNASFKNEIFEPLNNELSEGPEVLILHTHSTESYSAEGAISYKKDDNEFFRSDDQQENVVALGELLSEILNESGISTVHCKTSHDALQYSGSYERSKKTVQKYLQKYPTIKLVIDLQRDEMMSADGDLIKPITLVDQKPIAQIKFVVGSDWGGETYENWQKNLSLALKLRESINSKVFNLCRPCDLRESTYNQELAPYSLMVEIGACGNSLDEAKRSVEILGSEIAIKYIEFIK